MGDRIERVMLITAHPDDTEFGAGGTIAKMVKECREVVYGIATNGDKGSGDRTMTPERLARRTCALRSGCPAGSVSVIATDFGSAEKAWSTSAAPSRP